MERRVGYRLIIKKQQMLDVQYTKQDAVSLARAGHRQMLDNYESGKVALGVSDLQDDKRAIRVIEILFDLMEEDDTLRERVEKKLIGR